MNKTATTLLTTMKHGETALELDALDYLANVRELSAELEDAMERAEDKDLAAAIAEKSRYHTVIKGATGTFRFDTKDLRFQRRVERSDATFVDRVFGAVAPDAEWCDIPVTDPVVTELWGKDSRVRKLLSSASVSSTRRPDSPA